ncbi:mitochondrial inner membrane translocase subunit TIM44, putative [Talaromyces stipitatus ATCC 10500]|uniref:Mitochondrial import inner membrane translocase subunit TIM44 n=1 Tax=Talaromyces stipitatus (strain ATCC 10500 / CBS 375.48 / QM 6759 / NRRL 1006) TaxID=441959 RepID=B8LUU4_TALSN|nr:mitochondrial inner membrane translocase subunit TIM44, putative [Talaromyces stipitatus ATCC 10500]EED24036.1 mitochondrial inner membrane translocase subunit TIM44, putative [Talaromyces stipitatus ATCC 10500]
MIQSTRFGPAIAARTATFLPGRAYLSRTSNDHYRRLSTLLSDVRRTSQPSSFETTLLSSVLISRRDLHSTAIRNQEQKEQAHTNQKNAESEADGEKKQDGEGESSQEEKKKDVPPPPPHGDKTPWQVFTETLRSEFKKSKEWEESTKALASSAHHFTESESVKRARAAYEAASTTASSTTSSALKSTGRVIGQGAAWTWETPVVKGLRKGVSATGKGIEKVTRPVRETEAYKSVKEAIDDGSSSRYGGWIEKEERRRQRQQREENEAKSGRSPRVEHMEADPNAGTNLTVHKDSAWKESWRDFRDKSPVMQRLFSLKDTYNESENPLISTARSISDRVAGFFAENETARVIKKFREMDPSFQLEPFLREMREYILPEVLDAYVKGDIETLKLWLSDAQFSVYSALAQQYTTLGMKSDGRILDIRGVDIANARMLEPGDIPVFVVTCRTQEVHVYRNAKTNELAAGMEDRVQLVTYAIGVTRIPEDVNNPETRGWRMIELQKAARDYI